MKHSSSCGESDESESTIQQQQHQQNRPLSPITKRQRLQSTSTIKKQEKNGAIINLYENRCQNTIIAPIINAYLDRTDEELSLWQEIEMQRCYYENFLNSEFNDIQYPINQHDVYSVQIHNVEESAVSMAITEHGLNVNETATEQLDSSARLVVAVRPVPTTKPITETNISMSSSGSITEAENNNSSVTQPLSEIILDSYDFMEAAVAVAIERKGLFPL